MHKFLFILFFLFFINIKAYAGDKDIVIVESYSQNIKWDVDYANEIKKILGKEYKLTFFEMNTKVLPPTEHEAMGNKAWALIEKIKPTLVIVGDDPALKYVGPPLEQHQIRTVYLGINDNPRIYFSQEPKFVTGVLERPLIKRSAAYIKKILPNAKKMLILFDKSRTSQIIDKDFFNNQKSISISDITYDIALIDQYSEWKKIINKVNNEYDAIIIGIYYSVFENKKYVDHEQLIKWSEKNSKKPIFAFWDFAVGKEKAIGGLVLTGAGQGKAAAEIALQLLNDPKKLPNSIYPLFLQEGKFIFSKAEVKAKNINLPKEILDETTFVD
ncbi:ABC transporter substrate-binding protein [Pigmentibacter ruber]|nr:ABC transporter substrate binding protein [Pigmentibacter ruber]